MRSEVIEYIGGALIIGAALFTMTPTFWDLVRNGFYIFG